MDGHRFDTLVQTFHAALSRRRMLRALAGAGLGMVSLRTPAATDARKRHKHKKKPKLKRNEFGCVDVGGHCLGNSADCCSGICEGKKPRKTKKDTSVCVAHDGGVCFPDNDTCTVGESVPCNSINPSCFCVLTTGNAGFCGDFAFADSPCRDCSRDSDCQDEFGPGAACVFLGGICSSICAATGRTACIRPCSSPAP